MNSPDNNDPESPLAVWIVLVLVTCSSLILGTGIWSIFEMFRPQPEETLRQ